MALRGLLLCLMLFGASTVTASEQESLAAGPSPFVLIARLHALPNAAERVVALSRDVDAKVERGEPGMLLHTFDADPDDPNKFVWTEVYRKSEDFLFHADNPPVQDYVAKHSELATHFSIEIYGNVSQEVIDKINSLEIPLKHFATTSVGYVRSERFV